MMSNIFICRIKILFIFVGIFSTHNSAFAKMTHILKRIKPHTKDLDAEEATELCFQWLTCTLCAKPCFSVPSVRKYETKCTCIQFLAEEENTALSRAVAT